MASTHHAESLARQLAEDLEIRSGLAIATSTDASGNPTIAVGAGTAGSQSAFIRVRAEDLNDPSGDSPGLTNAFGMAQRVYTPHVIEVVMETSTVAGVSLVTEANKLKIIGELLKHGTKVKLYLSANTNAPDVADITTSNLVATWNQLYHPLTATI